MSIFPNTLSPRHFLNSSPSKLQAYNSNSPYRPTKNTKYSPSFPPLMLLFPLYKNTSHKFLTAKTSTKGKLFQQHTVFSAYSNGSHKPQYFCLSIHLRLFLSNNTPQKSLAAKTGYLDWFATLKP